MANDLGFRQASLVRDRLDRAKRLLLEKRDAQYP